MNNQEFISYLIPKVKNAPTLKSVAIAIPCLESGFGEKAFYNNIHGIKCHNTDMFAGCRVGKTKEYFDGSYGDYKLAFQTYDSVDDSIQDFFNLMTNAYGYKKDRYKRVREATNYLEATQAIKDCGYATSISYVNSLRKIIEKYKLYELDYKMNPNTQLTDNFTYYEFFSNSSSGIKIEPPEEYFETIKYIANQLQIVRDIIQRPIVITSAYRTKEWNKYVGGKLNSYHLSAKAVDITLLGLPLLDLALYFAKFTEFNGYGIAHNFIHIDLRDKFTIWKY